MDIKLNTSIDSLARIANGVKAARTSKPEETGGGFERSHALESQLQQTPDVRQEKVEKARNLVGDPAYPPKETMNRIAALLALHLDKSPEEV